MADERLGASFSIDVTQLKAGLAQANRLIRESESEFKSASAGMDDFTKSQEGLEAKIKSLNKIQTVQEEKVNALKKQYQKLLDDGVDPTSAQMVKLRTDINNANAAVEKTKKETKKYEEALENLGNEVKDFAEAQNEAKKSSGALDVAIGNLASNLVSSLGNAIKEAASNLMNLAEETREYREDIGKLKTAFESSGKSTEDATKIYKEFYSVLGEEDRSVEAVNHLAKFVETEEDMVKWTNIATGVWGTFGDSLPIEGLTEASNETVKVGKLTGVLADALNWAGVNEEKFQESLDGCSNEQERQALITETLNGLYADAAEKYRENNESIIKARKSASDYTDMMADMGEQMEPVNTAITEMKTQFIKEFVPVIKKDVIPAIDDFIGELEKDGTVKKFSKGISGIAKTVLPPLSKAVKFAAENIKTLAGVTLGAVTAYKVFSAAMKVSTAINAAKTAIAGLTAGTKLATVAQVGWNAAMSANPIGAVVTAIGLLIGGIAMLASSEKESTKSTELLNEEQRKTVIAAQNAAEAYRDTKQAADELAAAEMANIDYTENLWSELQTLTDENGKVKEGYEARAGFILGELNDALDTEYTMNGNIIESYQEIKKSIEEVIDTKKAQIILEAYEDSYREAVQKVATAEKARATQAQEIVAQKELLAQKEAESEAYLQSLRDKGWSEFLIQTDSEAFAKSTAVEKEKKVLSELTDKYKQTESELQSYYNTIEGYEMASSAALKGEVDKVAGYLNTYNSSFETATSVVGKEKEEQIAILKQQVIDTEINLGLIEEDFKQKEKSMTDEQKKQAQTRIDNARKQAEAAKEEYAKVGGNMVEGMAKGAEDGEWHLTGALKSTVNTALEAAKKVLGIASPSRVFKKQVGLMIPFGIAGGIDDGTGAIVKSIKKQSDEMQKAYDLPTVSARVENGIMSKNNPINSTNNTVKSVNVYQTNNYSQAHSRYELYKVKQQTAAAVRLALGGV